MVFFALLALCAQADPSGKYSGTDDVLGNKIFASMTYNDDGTMLFHLEGPLTVNCPNEPWSLTDDKITLTKTNAATPDDCIYKTLSQNHASIKQITYDDLFDELTVKVKYKIVDVNMILKKKSTAVALAAAESAPIGKYSGTDDILGTKIFASMTYKDDGTMLFHLEGPLTVNCPNEPWSLAGTQVTLTKTNEPNDCIYKALSTNHASIKKITYDDLFDELTVKVKYKIVDVNMILVKKSAETRSLWTLEDSMDADLEENEEPELEDWELEADDKKPAPPAGLFKGTKKEGKHVIHANMTFGDTVDADGATQNTLTLFMSGDMRTNCTGETYTMKPRGNSKSKHVIALTNLGQVQDCVTAEFKLQKTKLTEITYDARRKTMTLRMTRGKHTTNLKLKQTKATLADGGACMDAADQKKWNSDGQATFAADLSKCGHKCFGGHTCTAKCIAQNYGYTTPCATCFGELTGCTKKHCKFDCLRNSKGAKCKNCVDGHCTPAFETCSGLTPPGDATFSFLDTLADDLDAAGACMDAADQKKWNSDGRATFSADLSKCGHKCYGGHKCTAKCIEQNYGYTTPCATCFGELTGCTKKHCKFDCLRNAKGAKCKNCVDAHCTSDFKTCSGLTPPPSELLEDDDVLEDINAPGNPGGDCDYCDDDEEEEDDHLVAPEEAAFEELRAQKDAKPLKLDGTYEGQKTERGKTVKGRVSFVTPTTFLIQMDGAMKINCTSETYKESDDTKTKRTRVLYVPDLGKATDCLRNQLKKNKAEFKKMAFDTRKQRVELEIKKGKHTLKLNLGKAAKPDPKFKWTAERPDEFFAYEAELRQDREKNAPRLVFE